MQLKIILYLILFPIDIGLKKFVIKLLMILLMNSSLFLNDIRLNKCVIKVLILSSFSLIFQWSLKVCIWESYSGIKVTQRNEKIVKWNVTNAVSEVVIESIFGSYRSFFCWCVSTNDCYLRININSN